MTVVSGLCTFIQNIYTVFDIYRHLTRCLFESNASGWFVLLWKLVLPFFFLSFGKQIVDITTRDPVVFFFSIENKSF